MRQHELEPAYVGSPGLLQELRRDSARSLSLLTNDFDEDGVPDLIVGYSARGGGCLILHRSGERATFADSSEVIHDRGGRVTVTLPFVEPALAFWSACEPEFLSTGDFDADGHYDLAVAKSGGSEICVLLGDGSGNFKKRDQIQLSGAVTTMGAGDLNRPDGLADIAIGIVRPEGAAILVLSSPEGAMRGSPEVFAVEEPAAALAVADIDGDYFVDLLATGKATLWVVFGRDRQLSLEPRQQKGVPAARRSRIVLPWRTSSLAVGEFDDSLLGSEFALLADDGSLHLGSGASIAALPAEGGDIRDALSQAGAVEVANGRLAKAKVSTAPSTDLFVLDSSNRLVHIRSDSPECSQPLAARDDATLADDVVTDLWARLESASEATAVLPIRVDGDAFSDLVLLRSSTTRIDVVTTAAAEPFEVNDAGDQPDPAPGNCDCETSDGGEPCTLRAAIMESNACPGADTITFNLPPESPTIIPTTSLPTITAPLTLDGTTQPGFANAPLVEIDGSAAGAAVDGLRVTAGATAIRGLAINRFSGAGIRLEGGSGKILEGNFIGIGLDGATDRGNGGAGVHIVGTINHTIGGTTASARNVISGNAGDGVRIEGGGASGNNVWGNFIGTNAAGTTAVPNGGVGVLLQGVPGNSVGGLTAGADNLISGNQGGGIRISGTAGSSNLIQNNRVGTDVSGTMSISNRGPGVEISEGSSNTIGGTAASARNLISGNHSSVLFGVVPGVLISTAAARENLVQGNLIGTDETGTLPLPNFGTGVFIVSSSENTIGGVTPAAANLISANGITGITVSGPGPNRIQGNRIGTDVTGTLPLGNGQGGISLESASSTQIGGTDLGARNVISGNGSFGIWIDGRSGGFSTQNAVQGNLIGTDISGTVDLGNDGGGVWVSGNAFENQIGGSETGAGNVISGNESRGIDISGFANLIQGNRIGTNSNGTAALSNTFGGLSVGGFGNVIGGSSAGARNLVSGNGTSGVTLFGNSNTVEGNLIGVDITGSQGLPNLGFGLTVFGSGHTVGGTNLGTGNIISANAGGGVQIGGSGNVLSGNLIGTDATGMIGLGNVGSGVEIGSGNNTIGGVVGGAGNVISGNGLEGVYLKGSGASNNLIQGNLIGTTVSGTAPIGNTAAGLRIDMGSANTIGGSVPSAANVIGGNGHGIFITGSTATGNRVQGNYIGTDSTRTMSLGNYLRGVYVEGASGNSVGGAVAGEGNHIWNNGEEGVLVGGTSSAANAILGNSIDASGQLGIALSPFGPTPNDPCDADVGPNNLQNNPVLNSGSCTAGIQGQLDSTPDSSFSIEFFASATCDASGHGEGARPLGSTTVGTGGDCQGGFLIQVAGLVPQGHFVSATATDGAGNTSEFSQCVLVQGAPPSEVTVPTLAWSAGSVTSLQWDPTPGASAYNLYRGVPDDLPKLLTPALDSCWRFSGPDTTTGPVLVENPPAGSLYWYLVRAGNNCEGSVGNASAGPRIHESTGACLP